MNFVRDILLAHASLLRRKGDEGYRNRGFHASGIPILQAQLKLVSVEALEPCSHVGYPDSGMSLLPPGRQTRAIVTNAERDCAVRANRGNLDCSSLNPFRDSVLDGIFHHGLQNQAGNLPGPQVVWNIQPNFKTLGKSNLLNVEILLRKL